MLIVFEGIDGCGKTTQLDRLCARMDAMQKPYQRLREPGGTALGEALRQVLLDPKTAASPVAELFTYLAARAQLCQDVIAAALALGELVVLDRFWHSTIAYQAYGLGLPLGQVRGAIELAVGEIKPDKVLWLDVPVEECLKRRSNAGADRIERRGAAYLERVRAGYLALAQSGELVRIDGVGTPEAVEQRIKDVLGSVAKSRSDFR
jgi:dTMP kinase